MMKIRSNIFACLMPILCNSTVILAETKSALLEISDTGTDKDLPGLSYEAEMRQGKATYFGGLGSPAGACGLPQWVVETSNFVALNVQNAQANIPGEFAQGRNCGRWIEVTLGKFCKNSDHSDRWNTSNCEGGNWEDGALTGSKAYFIVADSCNDGNYWCRQDRFHLDLSASGLSQFGIDVNTSTWRNPQVNWRYVDAPNYSGDVQMGFARGASQAWPALIIKHLQNGIHKVEQLVNGQWAEQKMFLTLGQVYILTNVGSEPFKIRLYDAEDRLVKDGQIYNFSMPTGCCGQQFNEVSYKTE